MDIYEASLTAGEEKSVVTATASALALKLGCSRKDAAIVVKIGSKSPKLLGCSSWLDTRNLYIMPGEELRLTSNLDVLIWYHFQEIEINKVVVTTQSPSFSWNSTNETLWNSTNETLWNGG